MNRFTCPDPEVLAAFIDGRLSAQERRQVVEHLDRCEECYEVVAETARFQGEEVPGARVVTPPSERWGRRQRWIWAAAAAAVVVAVIALPMIGPDTDDVRLSTADLVGSIGGDPELLVRSRWTPPPALGFAPDPSDLAFHVGVRLVDLQVATRTGSAGAVRDELERLERALDGGSRIGRGLVDVIGTARSAVRRGRRGEMEAAVGAIEARADRSLDPYSLGFGKWVEAGRLAAAVGDADFFQSTAFAGFRGEVSEQEEDPTVTELLEILERDPLSTQDLAEAKKKLANLLTSH